MSAPPSPRVTLLCPACRWELSTGDGSNQAYECAACGRHYAVRGGVPRLLLDLGSDERQVQRAFDFEHARYRDSRRVHFRPELMDEFCADVRLPASWFAGKSVLDAGCGSGRWSYALAQMGARVTAVDLTDSGARATAQALSNFPDCAVYQASLFDLPFPAQSFDFVVSWGVLHHTPDTYAAFRRLVPLVRPGGVLYVMLYERTAKRYRVLTNVVRALLRRLPDAARYRACEALVIGDPGWYRRISPWLKVCDGSAARDPLERSTLVFDTFDAYSPRFNYVHTATEAQRWLAEAGFGDVLLTHPVRYTTPDAIARWGECGGAVHVRGVRRSGASGLIARLPSFRGAQSVTAVTAATAARPAAGSGLPAFDCIWHDPWHGVSFRYPGTWEVRARGAEVVVAPNVAIPPFQSAVYVTRADRGQPLQDRAAAAFARWFKPGQQATLLHEDAISVSSHGAIRRRYRLRFGNVQAPATFVSLEHNGALCQVYAVAAWAASEDAVAEMEAALEALLETLTLTPPRHDARAALGHAARYRSRIGPALRRLAGRARRAVGGGRR